MGKSATSLPPARAGVVHPGRRTFLGAGFGLVVVAVAGTTGCAGIRAGLTPASAGAEGELEFFWYVEGDRAKYSIEAAARFEDRNDGVTINPRHTAYAPYWDKLATETAGGNPPDIFQIELARQAEYAGRGTVRPVEDLVPDLLEHIEQDVLESCMYEDDVHFIPTGLSTSPALVSNETLLGDIGVTAPPDVWLQDDYTAFCHDVRDASGGEVYGTSDLGGSHWALQAFARSRGEDPFSPDGRLTLSRRTVADWLGWWQDLRASEACVPMTRSAESGGFENFPVITRDAVISSTASAKGMLGLQGLTDDHLDLLPFPLAESDGPAGVMVAPIEWWAISSRTTREKAQLAGDFCAFVLTDEASVDGMVIEHGIPVVPELRERARAGAGDIVRRTFDDFDRARASDPRPVTPQPVGAGELFTQVLTTINEDIGFGRITVDEAVATFFTEADRVFA